MDAETVETGKSQGVGNEALASIMKDEDIISQKTPFGINRYVLVVIYLTYVILTGCVYFGWTGLSTMLFESGAYSWLCDTEAIEHNKVYLCAAQDTAVQLLFQISMASHFTMSALAGSLIDNIGPKYTAMLGQSFNFIGWLFVIFSGQNFDGYKAGFVFIGLGADTGFLPTLSGAKLFPKYNALVLAILGAANSASFGVPLVMEAITKSLGVGLVEVSYGYLVVIGVCFAVAVLLLPRTVFVGNAYHKAVQAPVDSTPSFAKILPAIKSFINDFVSAKKDFFSVKYTSILIYFALTSLIYNFYVVSSRTLLGENPFKFFGIVQPFSFVPCILYGYVVDRLGAVFVLATNTLFGLLAYITANINVEALKYMSAICTTIYVSFYTSQMYCYIQEKFNEDNFGKLVGVASASGGLISLLATFLYDPLTKKTFDNNMVPVSVMMCGLLCINWLIMIFMRGSQKTIATAKNGKEGTELSSVTFDGASDTA